MSFGDTYRSFKQLAKDTYFTCSYEEEKKMIGRSMSTKVWIIHMANMALRVIFAIFGVAYWQKVYGDDYKENDKFDVEFVTNSEQCVKVTIITLIPIGITLDILVWKYRHYASLLYIYEMISLSVHSFMPFDKGDFASVLLLGIVSLMFVVMSRMNRSDILISVLTIIVIEFLVYPSMQEERLTAGDIVSKVTSILYTVVMLTVLSMAITYVAQIKGKMSVLMVENLNLLDRMDEGLIVLSTDSSSGNSRNVEFTSEPAINLFYDKAEKGEEAV